ncbi:heterogeneous nuclear ribonucleoprotein 27C-like protein [Sarcoptes scabiei]|uniref:Heterogeneous nuclear ribonucleoprotein 27C-like protein n=1 Tax=Sarcoptes scabiei TaxID=52283 RepID=A0A132A500_SARSC|nr:heterogeneous nuclear ribonucleoprotein 27C-like protein [Sarcoptes scabiei]
MADGTEEGKIFVGGLSWETNEDKLKKYFSDFGEIIECLIVRNPETGKSRGFGFVTFNDPLSVRKVLRVSNHQLDGRNIDPKECNSKSATTSRKDSKQHLNSSKIFLGGLPPNITETNLIEFFSKYGKVVEAIIMFDQEKKKSRGMSVPNFFTLNIPFLIKNYIDKKINLQNGSLHTIQKSNINSRNVSPMPCMMMPWGMWQPFMPPMNGMPPGYSSNLWSAAMAAGPEALGNCSDGPNFSQQPRPNSNITTIFPPYNTHGNGIVSGQLPGSWPPSSFGNGTLPAAAANNVTNPMMVAQPSTAVPNQSNSDNMSTSYNQSLQFHGSRLMSQSQGYHPYRRS